MEKEKEKFWDLDSRTYFCLFELITRGKGLQKENFSQFFHILSILPADQARYSRVENVLKLLIVYPSLISFSCELLADIARELVRDVKEGKNGKKDDCSNADTYLQNIGNWVGITFENKKTAKLWDSQKAMDGVVEEINIDCEKKCQEIGVELTPGQTDEQKLMVFVRARLLLYAKIYPDMKPTKPISKLVQGFPPFDIWYEGQVRPFLYYWEFFASTYEPESFSLYVSLKEDSVDEQFIRLVSPMTEGPWVSLQMWMDHVVKPFIAYNNYDYRILIEHFFSNKGWCAKDAFHKYAVWDVMIRSILPNIKTEQGRTENQVLEVVRFYVASIYYYAIYSDTPERIPSVEITKVYDQVSETLKAILDQMETNEAHRNGNLRIDISNKDVPFKEFLEDKSMQNLFKPTSDNLSFMLNAIQTCRKLHPINKFTLDQFLSIKFTAVADKEYRRKEIAKILNGLNNGNWEILLEAVELFIETLPHLKREDCIELNEFVIDRFLFSNLFDVLKDSYRNKKIKISQEVFCDFLIKKLWKTLREAKSFNSSELWTSMRCMNLLDVVSSEGGILEKKLKEINRLKHLIKVVSAIKSYNFISKQGKHFTPSSLVESLALCSQEELKDLSIQHYSPIKLITTILDQNSEAYANFEKLSTLINDFFVFLDEQDISTRNCVFSKLRCACIEASLLDNNFPFAYNQSTEMLREYSEDKVYNASDIWLALYQVGSYHSAELYEMDDPKRKLEILVRQREILSKTLKCIRDPGISLDSSYLVVSKWETVNSEIEELYLSFQETHKSDQTNTEIIDTVRNRRTVSTDKVTSQNASQDFNKTTYQARDKLSNLFVSGLGWAIGANVNE